MSLRQLIPVCLWVDAAGMLPCPAAAAAALWRFAAKKASQHVASCERRDSHAPRSLTGSCIAGAGFRVIDFQ